MINHHSERFPATTFQGYEGDVPARTQPRMNIDAVKWTPRGSLPGSRARRSPPPDTGSPRMCMSFGR